MCLTDAEQKVCEAIAAEGDKLVALASELIGFDTTARDVGDPARDEVALQDYLAEATRAMPAPRSTSVEPDADAMAASRWFRRGSTSPAGRS